jgi:hypothetical protein
MAVRFSSNGQLSNPANECARFSPRRSAIGRPHLDDPRVFTLRSVIPISEPNASPSCHLSYAGMFDPGRSFGKSVGMLP